MTHFNRVTGNLKLMILCVCIELWQQFLCLGQGALVCHGEISSCLKYIIAIGVLKVWCEEEYVLGTVILGLRIAPGDVKGIAVAGTYCVNPGVVALHVFDHIIGDIIIRKIVVCQIPFENISKNALMSEDRRALSLR